MQPGAFRVPPEVPRYFASKKLTPRFSWLDVWGEEHAYAFTVAKATEIELLDTFRKSIAAAIDKGQGFETWRDNLKPELERLGWWRKRLVADPKGKLPDTVVDFSSPRRLQTIFWGNMRGARAAGQWERIDRTKKALPYLVYVRTTSAEPRPEHLGWVGIILPVDHPFWRSHFPPNGWFCKCSVRQITAREAEQLIATGDYLTEAPPIVKTTFRNHRTGEVIRVPVGIDPGWQGNPGIAAARRRALHGSLKDKIEASQQVFDGGQIIRPLVAKVVREIVAGPSFTQLHDQTVAAVKIRRAVKKTAKAAGLDLAAQDAAAAAAAPWQHAALPVAVLPTRLDAWRSDRPITVTVTDAAIGHSYSSHPTPAIDWALIQELLERGEILHGLDKDSKKIWAFVEKDGRHYMAVLVDKAGAWRALTFFGGISSKYRDKQRRIEGRRILMPERKRLRWEGE